MDGNSNYNENQYWNLNFQKEIYAQYVRYTGENSTYFNNSNSIVNLDCEKIYKVVYADINSTYTNLTLQEIDTGKVLEGKFNSCMFSFLKGYIAIAMEKPSIGSPMNLVRVVKINGEIKTQLVKISPIIHIDIIAENIFSIITRSSVYIVNL